MQSLFWVFECLELVLPALAVSDHGDAWELLAGLIAVLLHKIFHLALDADGGGEVQSSVLEGIGISLSDLLPDLIDTA